MTWTTITTNTITTTTNHHNKNNNNKCCSMTACGEFTVDASRASCNCLARSSEWGVVLRQGCHGWCKDDGNDDENDDKNDDENDDENDDSDITLSGTCCTLTPTITMMKDPRSIGGSSAGILVPTMVADWWGMEYSVAHLCCGATADDTASSEEEKLLCIVGMTTDLTLVFIATASNCNFGYVLHLLSILHCRGKWWWLATASFLDKLLFYSVITCQVGTRQDKEDLHCFGNGWWIWSGLFQLVAGSCLRVMVLVMWKYSLDHLSMEVAIDLLCTW